MLVLEPRTCLAQRDAEYWLKLIETQGGSSPVIVVMNYSRDRRWPLVPLQQEVGQERGGIPGCPSLSGGEHGALEDRLHDR